MEHILSMATQYVVPFIIVISVVVFAHEFGHFWIARKCGIKVETFSLGFGPRLFGWTDKHGTSWQIACLPLGGYVKMFGDADPSSMPDESVKTMSDEEKRVAFFHQKVGKRIAVVAAGPLANYLFAIIVLAFLFMFQGQPYSVPVVGGIQEQSVAAKAGFQIGDLIVSMDGTKIERFEDVKRIVAKSDGTAMPVVVERNGALQTMTVTPEVAEQTDRFGSQHRMGKIGIYSGKLDHKKWPPLKAIERASAEAWTMSVDTLKGVGEMIMGTRGAEELGGPLRIAEMSGQIAQDGIWALTWFTAIISINLGLINLFPIPLLDGGHIVFYAFEKLRGRPLDERAQEVGARIGLIVVLSLMFFATWNDLVHLEVISKIKTLLS